jgi:acetyl/propionyl-CoA carboxylase alpha subunit
MRVVSKPEDLQTAYRSARSEALSAFGDDRVYVERYIEQPRHIEFQILADSHGTTVHLGERECSIQRRHQKIIEESPSVVMDSDLRARMGGAAVKAAQACRYINAGTIEFLVDAGLNYYFLEMNTRLQVEHPVTEMRTGIDLVACQLKVADGQPLDFGQDDVSFRGHSIECRIYAEDPSNNYLPSTGTIHHLHPAQGFGVRDDRGVAAGSAISLYYDPMISKLVTWGLSREEALRRMDRALREYEILGVSTNIPLNLGIIRHPDFIAGNFNTHFLATHPAVGVPIPLEKAEERVIAAFAALLHFKKNKRSAIGENSGRTHPASKTAEQRSS